MYNVHGIVYSGKIQLPILPRLMWSQRVHIAHKHTHTHRSARITFYQHLKVNIEHDERALIFDAITLEQLRFFLLQVFNFLLLRVCKSLLSYFFFYFYERSRVG